jgi:hypothetical protein
MKKTIYFFTVLSLGIYSTARSIELNTLEPINLDKKYESAYKKSLKNPIAKTAFFTDRWKSMVQIFLASEQKFNYTAQKELFEQLLTEDSDDSKFLLNFLIVALKSSVVESERNPLLAFFRKYAINREKPENITKDKSVAFKKALDSKSLERLLLGSAREFKDALKAFFMETLPTIDSNFRPSIPVECWMDSYMENKLESKDSTVVQLFDIALGKQPIAIGNHNRSFMKVHRQLNERVLKYIYSKFKIPYLKIIKEIIQDDVNPIKFFASLNSIATLCSDASQADKKIAFKSLNEESRRLFSQIYIKETSLKDTEQSSYLKNFLDDFKSTNPDEFDSLMETLAQEQIESIEQYATLTDAALLKINESVKILGTKVDLDKIKNPLVKALAASNIIGQLAGENDLGLKDRFRTYFVFIQNTLDTPKFFVNFPNTWRKLAKQCLNGIAGDDKKSDLTTDEVSNRSAKLIFAERAFRKTLPKRGTIANRLSSWLREYCSISTLILKTRTVSTTEEKRYETTTKLARSIQESSKLDPRDVAIKIGIVLQNLSGKDEVAGQPEELLQALSQANITLAIINDEIISRLPNLSVKKRGILIKLDTMFMKGLGDLKITPDDSLDYIKTRDEFNPATAPIETTIQDPKKPDTTSTKTDGSNDLPGATDSPTKSISEEEKQRQKREEEAKKIAAEKSGQEEAENRLAEKHG